MRSAVGSRRLNSLVPESSRPAGRQGVSVYAVALPLSLRKIYHCHHTRSNRKPRMSPRPDGHAPFHRLQSRLRGTQHSLLWSSLHQSSLARCFLSIFLIAWSPEGLVLTISFLDDSRLASCRNSVQPYDLQQRSIHLQDAAPSGPAP